MPQPMQQQSRIDLSDLKGQIFKKIGASGAQRYFSCLNRLLSGKLGKAEFCKLCQLTLGRENLPLHNRLIQSILKNAYHGKVLPPPPSKEEFKLSQVGGRRLSPGEDGHSDVGVNSSSPTPSSTLLVGSSGNVLPSSGNHDRKRPRDQLLVAAGTTKKTGFVSHPAATNDEASGKSIVEYEDSYACDMQRPLQRRKGFVDQPEDEFDASLPFTNKWSRIRRPQDEQFSVHSKGPGEVVIEDREEVKQKSTASSGRISLLAPLGIQFSLPYAGGARRGPHVGTSGSSFTTCFDVGELSGTATLRKRMEQIAGTAGLDGVSLDCANLLNNGLDIYLKQLIKSCIELVGARSGPSVHEVIKQSVYKQNLCGKIINGYSSGHQMHSQGGSGNSEVLQIPKIHSVVSLLDFKVAMELNPQQLGENWPLLLEKICIHPSKG